MKQYAKGLTLVELLVVVALVAILLAIVSGFVINNMGWTEARAKDNALFFISENHLQVSRMSCAGDSDHDGYGSCTVVLVSGENISLQCPTDFLQVKIFGATGCKELSGINKFIISR